MGKSSTESFARTATCWTGSTRAFVLACVIVVVWLLSGPAFGFSDTWQLAINTGTTIVTFLMVFLIQRSQNNDSRALHLKLNELIAAVEGASSRLVNVEDLSEEQLFILHQRYAALAQLAKEQQDLTRSHTIEEAEHQDRQTDNALARPTETTTGSGGSPISDKAVVRSFAS